MNQKRPVSARVLCVSAELSGDTLLAPIVRELTRHGHRPFGIGGDLSKRAGLEMMCHVDTLSAAGLMEALPALPRHVRVLAQLKQAVKDADSVLVVDAPELGMRLVKTAARRGVRTAYLAPPQAWAWRSWRARIVARCDWIGCLFPFERDWYVDRQVNAVCVGHPLAQIDPLPRGEGSMGIALLPGSRMGYVKRILPMLLEAAQRCTGSGLTFHIPVANPRLLPMVERCLESSSLPIHIHHEVKNALANSAFAVCAAGTATLECVAFGRPIIAVARAHPVSEYLASTLVNTPHFALPNLCLGRRAFPELIGKRCTPQALVKAMQDMLAHELAYRAEVDAVRHALNASHIDYTAGLSQFLAGVEDSVRLD